MAKFNVGDKVKVSVDQDSERPFDFENTIKLNYDGYDDEIVKKIVLNSMSFFNHKFNSYSLIGFIYSDYSKQYDEFIDICNKIQLKTVPSASMQPCQCPMTQGMGR